MQPNNKIYYTYDECLTHKKECHCDGCFVYRTHNIDFCKAKGIELDSMQRLVMEFKDES